MARPPADSPLLNAELIYTTALRLIDQDGLEALSMRKLASELEVTPRSLYHYVETKDALLHEVYKVVLAELELPNLTQGTWLDKLRQVSKDFRSLCHKHRNVAPYFLAGHQPVAREAAIFELLFALLTSANVPDTKLVIISRALVTFLTGYILAELSGILTLEQWKARVELAQETPETYPLLLNTAPPPESADEAFEVALDVLLGGLKGLAEAE